MNPTNRLLMISYPFPPNPSAGAVRSERFARYLAEYGWNIDLITIKPQQNRTVNDSELFDKKITIHRTRTLDPWLWLSNRIPENIILRGIRSVLMRLFSFPDHMFLWLPFALIRGLKICKGKKVSAIYTTSPPHSSQIIGYLLSRITGIPWVADFRDPWTLNAYRGTGVVDDVLVKIATVMEKAVYKTASYVLANTPANKRNLLKAFPQIPDDHVVYLPNGWEPFGEGITGVENGNNAFTIVHAGTFYPRFKPYALLYAMAAWKGGVKPDDVPGFDELNVKIHLFGAKDTETRKLVRQLDLDDYVDIIPWIPQADVRKKMCSADLLWVTLGTGPESSTYVPSKLFEYIAAKKPIIGFFPNGDAASLIRETRTGVVFSSDDPMPIITHIHDMMTNQHNIYNPDRESVERYHIKSVVKSFDDLLNKMAVKTESHHD